MAEARFDELIHPSTRLSIVALLASADWIDFAFVRDRLGLSDSALSKQFATLEDILARAVDRGEPPLVLALDSLEDPQNLGTLLRSAEAAQAAADAAQTALARAAVRGRLLVAGRPAVRLGDAVEVKDVPGAGVDGRYQVRSVTHRLAKDRLGFTTEIGVRGLD